MERLKTVYNVSILLGHCLIMAFNVHNLADQSLEKNRPFHDWRYSWGRPHTSYIMETRRHCQL